MTTKLFCVEALLPSAGALADPYQDPHDVYLMLLRAFDAGLMQLVSLLPIKERRRASLVTVRRPPSFWTGVLDQIGRAWLRDNDVELDAAMFRAYEKALRHALASIGQFDPVIL
jgi:hypothetical protein